MTLFEGDTLELELLEGKVAVLQERADALQQILLAIAEVHAAGFVVRDIKPENIIADRVTAKPFR